MEGNILYFQNKIIKDVPFLSSTLDRGEEEGERKMPSLVIPDNKLGLIGCKAGINTAYEVLNNSSHKFNLS